MGWQCVLLKWEHPDRLNTTHLTFQRSRTKGTMGKLALTAMAFCFLGVTIVAEAAPGTSRSPTTPPPWLPRWLRCQYTVDEQCKKIMDRVWSQCKSKPYRFPIGIDPYRSCVVIKLTDNDGKICEDYFSKCDFWSSFDIYN